MLLQRPVLGSVLLPAMAASRAPFGASSDGGREHFEASPVWPVPQYPWPSHLRAAGRRSACQRYIETGRLGVLDPEEAHERSGRWFTAERDAALQTDAGQLMRSHDAAVQAARRDLSAELHDCHACIGDARASRCCGGHAATRRGCVAELRASRGEAASADHGQRDGGTRLQRCCGPRSPSHERARADTCPRAGSALTQGGAGQGRGPGEEDASFACSGGSVHRFEICQEGSAREHERPRAQTPLRCLSRSG